MSERKLDLSRLTAPSSRCSRVRRPYRGGLGLAAIPRQTGLAKTLTSGPSRSSRGQADHAGEPPENA